MSKKIEYPREAPEIDTSRRRALAKLGLSALAAYAAPMVLNLNQAAAKDSPEDEQDDVSNDAVSEDSVSEDSVSEDSVSTDSVSNDGDADVSGPSDVQG